MRTTVHHLCLPAPCPLGWHHGHVPMDQRGPADKRAGAQLSQGSWAILSQHLSSGLIQTLALQG